MRRAYSKPTFTCSALLSAVTAGVNSEVVEEVDEPDQGSGTDDL